MLVGQHRLRVRVMQHSLQVLLMARLIRVIQRDRHLAGVEHAHERENVLRRVACQDGHAVPRLTHLHQTGSNCLDARVGLAAGVGNIFTIRVLRVVPEANVDVIFFACLVQHFGHGWQRESRRDAHLALVIEEALDDAADIHRTP